MCNAKKSTLSNFFSNLTKAENRRESHWANPMAKEVTVGVEPAIWNHKGTRLPPGAERPHGMEGGKGVKNWDNSNNIKTKILF